MAFSPGGSSDVSYYVLAHKIPTGCHPFCKAKVKKKEKVNNFSIVPSVLSDRLGCVVERSSQKSLDLT